MNKDDYTKKRLEKKLAEIIRDNRETSRDGKIYFSYLIAYLGIISLFLLFLLFLFFKDFGLKTYQSLSISLVISLLLFGSIASFFPKIYRSRNEEDIRNKLAEYKKIYED